MEKPVKQQGGTYTRPCSGISLIQPTIRHVFEPLKRHFLLSGNNTARKRAPQLAFPSCRQRYGTQTSPTSRHGAEQYAGDLECVFYGYHLDRAILKFADATYCFMPSLPTSGISLLLQVVLTSAAGKLCPRLYLP